MGVDLKFSEAVIDPSYTEIASQVQNDRVKEVAEVFVANIDRVVAILKSPSINQEIGIIMEGVQMVIAEERFGADALKILISDRKQIEDEQFFRLVIARFANNLDTIKGRLEDISTFTWKNQARRVDRLLSIYEVGRIPEGIKAILSAAIIGTWTAFEAMATDAWIAALNSRPMSLGVNALRAKKRDKSNGSDNRDEADEKYTPISLDILKQYNFNLNSYLGTMIHEKLKFDFNSLEGIRYAYQQVFCFYDNKNRIATPTEVKGWFSGDGYNELACLEAIRHVLVHRAGRVDRKFLDRVKESHTVFSDLQINDVIHLDGMMVQEYVMTVVKRAIILLQGVDKWLMKPE